MEKKERSFFWRGLLSPFYPFPFFPCLLWERWIYSLWRDACRSAIAPEIVGITVGVCSVGSAQQIIRRPACERQDRALAEG